MGPGVLSKAISGLPKFTDENLLVGFDTSDDACVYRLREDLAVIQTVDFFPPMVDDAYLYGQIAAANALSDIYAMGAEPTLALNILCFPNCLPPEVMRDILAGGADKVAEAGAVIAGGHSVEDDEPKYGLCVSGFAHPQAIWSNAGAREGDALLLTKALGSGILNTAAKADLLDDAQMRPARDTMARLNKYARDIAADYDVHGCTDITGFGLLGHACEMADASGKTLALQASAFAVLPHALDMARMGIIPRGAYANREHTGGRVWLDEVVQAPIADVLYDPQTSGGLLLAVPQAQAQDLLADLRRACPDVALVGRVLAREEVSVRVTM